MKLYTASWCNPCQELKAWMKERNISYSEVDVDGLGKVGCGALGITSVPTLVRKGNYYVGREEIKPFLGGTA